MPGPWNNSLGLWLIIYSAVGFNYRLKDDPKYADNIKRLEDADKYNM